MSNNHFVLHKYAIIQIARMICDIQNQALSLSGLGAFLDVDDITLKNYYN